MHWETIAQLFTLGLGCHGAVASAVYALQPPERKEETVGGRKCTSLYLNGKLHCLWGPARVYEDGGEEWWQHGVMHRDDGPAVKGWDGYEEWHQHGEMHRDDGPAIKHPDGYEEWRQLGVLHRDGGPARTWPDGREEYWLSDVQYSKSEFHKRISSSAAPPEHSSKRTKT